MIWWALRSTILLHLPLTVGLKWPQALGARSLCTHAANGRAPTCMHARARRAEWGCVLRFQRSRCRCLMVLRMSVPWRRVLLPARRDGAASSNNSRSPATGSHCASRVLITPGCAVGCCAWVQQRSATHQRSATTVLQPAITKAAAASQQRVLQQASQHAAGVDHPDSYGCCGRPQRPGPAPWPREWQRATACRAIAVRRRARRTAFCQACW